MEEMTEKKKERDGKFGKCVWLDIFNLNIKIMYAVYNELER